MIFNTNNIDPIHKIDGNCIFGKNGDISFAFSISFPEVYSLSENDYDSINSELNRFFNMFSCCIIHSQDFYIKSNFDGSFLENKTFIQKASYNHFQNRKYLKHFSFLYITFPNIKSLKRSYLNSKILQTSKYFKEDKTLLTRFIKEVDRAIAVINSSRYFNFVPLSDIDIKQINFQLLNGFGNGKLTDIEFKPDFKIGGQYANIYALNSSDNLPDKVPTCTKDEKISSDTFTFYKSFLAPIGFDLDCNHIVNKIIFIDGHKEIKEEISKSEIEFNSLTGFSKDNLKKHGKLKLFSQTLNDNENIKLCRAHVNLLVWEKDKASLDIIDNLIVSSFKQSDMTPYHATYVDHIYYYLSTLPGAAGSLPRQETFITEFSIASAFFMPVTNYKSDDIGFMFNERMNNIPVLKDDYYAPYEKKEIGARNAFIIAPTGLGKSVLLNHMLRQSVEQDFIVTLIEMGKSFEILSHLFPKEQTTYIQYVEGEPLGLNPFLIKDKSELTADKIRSLANFLFILWKRGKTEEDYERVSLYKIIKEYYNNNSSLSFPDFYSFVKKNPSLHDTLDFPKKYFDRDEFLHVTSEYAEGIFKFLLEDKKQKFYLNNKRFVGFELENIKDNLDILPIMFMSILDITENVIWKNKTADKRIWFDEAAKFLKYPVMLKAIDYYFQTIRKHDGSIGLVLQNIDQIPNNDIGNAIISNTHTYFILKQDKDIAPLVKRLNLSNHDSQQIFSISNNFTGDNKYTEFFFKQLVSNVFRLELPPEALMAYQSEGKSKKIVLDEFAKTNNMENAITNLLNK